MKSFIMKFVDTVIHWIESAIHWVFSKMWGGVKKVASGIAAGGKAVVSAPGSFVAAVNAPAIPPTAKEMAQVTAPFSAA